MFSSPVTPPFQYTLNTVTQTLRDECLNEHWFVSLDDAREKIEAWRRDYNEVRPHSALVNRTPWVFATPRTQGRRPYWPDCLLPPVIRPAAERAGIQKLISWHTFRHSFCTLLMANGENVKIVQQLMRHANCRSTLEIYSQARIEAKRAAQHRLIEMISSG